MLKKIRLLFLGLIVLAGSACVTPTHASSAPSVVLTYIQPAGLTAAKEEIIVLHNNSSVAVDITDWCLINKAPKAFACFDSRAIAGSSTQYMLPAYGDAIIASHDYMAAHALESEVVSLVYEVTNQSSGSVVNSADTVSLVNAEGTIIDAWTWKDSPPSGKAWARKQLSTSPEIYAVNEDSGTWEAAAWPAILPNALEVPTVTTVENDGNTAPAISTITITELLPNPAGIDKGGEFIEFYNPDPLNAQTLDGLRLQIGASTPRWYTFPAGFSIPPQSYRTFSDSELGFTLPNTAGSLQLYQGEMPLGERIEYNSPKDDAAWALINGVWQYTMSVTPGAHNAPSVQNELTSTASPLSTVKPCAANQYRNPETGRCKLLAAASPLPAPCKVGQERNPETNRCRTVAAVSAPVPCKEGQERNPETNRCRNIVKMTNASYGVKGVQAQASVQLQWYYWAAIGAVVLLILGYAVWEWRQELAGLWQQLKTRFAKH